MPFIKHIADTIIRREYERTAKYLTESSAEKLAADGDKKLIPAFRHAARTVPFYKNLLSAGHIDPDSINTISDFTTRVPVVNKNMVFAANALKDICTNGSLEQVCLVYSSSGSSRSNFSFGVETWQNRTRIAAGLEFLFDTAFEIFQHKTFVINCLPMGVKIFTRTLPVAETSVREDVVLALIMKLKDEFDQFIIIGESLFLKKVFEDGAAQGVPWKDIRINAITGGEYVAESLRSYLAEILGIDFTDPDTGTIAVNMGLSELSLSIFSENTQTIQIRQALQNNKLFKKALLGDTGINYTPLIMQYFPQQTWLENLPDKQKDPRLIVSLLNPKLKIPLIRYDTEDMVELYPFPKMAAILKQFGYGNLTPQFKLPFGIITGKKQTLKNKHHDTLSVCAVKEALFQNTAFNPKITGNFKLLLSPDKEFKVEMQLQKGEQVRPDMAETFHTELKKTTGQQIDIQLMPYLAFGHGIEHNFERKNQYL